MEECIESTKMAKFEATIIKEWELMAVSIFQRLE